MYSHLTAICINTCYAMLNTCYMPHATCYDKYMLHVEYMLYYMPWLCSILLRITSVKEINSVASMKRSTIGWLNSDGLPSVQLRCHHHFPFAKLSMSAADRCINTNVSFRTFDTNCIIRWSRQRFRELPCANVAVVDVYFSPPRPANETTFCIVSK